MSKSIQQWCCGLLLAAALGSPSLAAERPTFNVTCDPRPNILAHPLYYAHTEYRREYNRPRYYPGWLAYKLAPTSQEAMVWYENKQAGNYDVRNAPPMYKRYYAPKPWEVLQTGPRPNSLQYDNPLRSPEPLNAPAPEAEPIKLGAAATPLAPQRR